MLIPILFFLTQLEHANLWKCKIKVWGITYRWDTDLVLPGGKSACLQNCLTAGSPDVLEQTPAGNSTFEYEIYMIPQILI